jgi:hypothetical protein
MAKREPHWVKLFLRGLARLGNVRLAAEGAGVDFSTAYQRRKRHGDFAEAWEGALQNCAERGEGAEGVDAAPDPSTSYAGPPPRTEFREELSVRPDGKVVRAGAGRWSVARERRFLIELADSANVRRAAGAAGLSTAALYARRMRQPAFRAAWDLAIEAGKARLQAYLIEAADRTFDPESLPVPEGSPKVSVSEAVSILRLKGGEPTAHLAPAVEVDGEEHKAAVERIILRLDRLKQRIDEEKRAAGWTEHEGEWIPPGWVRVEAAR